MFCQSSRSRLVLPLILLVALACAVAGCSDDTTEPEGTPPDASVAADLSAPAKTAGQVGETLEDLQLFESPMTDLAGDVGIYQETPSDIWTGEPIAFPQKSAEAAAAFRSARELTCVTGTAANSRQRHLEEVTARVAYDAFGKEAGDTISVEYFDGPDSTGLDALIETETTDLVRFVMLREYPPLPLEVVRRETEILIDTGGTLENPADDEYHSATMEREMFGGEVATGTLAPVSGDGPMLPGVRVLATYRVNNPRFHPLQEWTEAEVVLDPGEFETEGDEVFYSFEGTVHWRNDAEHHAAIAAVDEGPLAQETTARAVGSFTAAPANRWLESVADTLHVRLGDLDDEDDDFLLDASRAAVFDGIASDGGAPHSYARFLPEEPVAPGDEPCGGEAYQDVWYPAEWWLVHLERDASIACDGGGTLHVLMEFRNGTSYERTIVWDGVGGATVTENRTDGTTFAGSYDEATGEFSLATTFPTGHDPVSRHRCGQALDGTIEAYDVLVWQDAHPDSAYFMATETESGSSVSGYHVVGPVREEYSLTSGDDQLTGEWSRNDGATGTFSLAAVDGGGGHLTFSAANPTEDGDPSIAGEIFFAADGSGTGTIIYTQYGVTVMFDVVILPDGTAHIVDGAGNEIPI